MGPIVVGFPVHVRVVFISDNADETTSGLFEFDPRDIQTVFGVRLRGADGSPILAAEPRRPRERHNEPTGSIEGEGSYGGIADFYSLLDLDSLRLGRHELSVGYISAPDAIWSAPREVDVVAPTSEQRQWLSIHAAVARETGSWWWWVRDQVDAAVFRAPVSATSPARYNLVVRRLLQDTESLAAMDLRLLDVLGMAYEPEASLLRAEMLCARGAQREAEAVASSTVRAHPELAQRFATILEGVGPITEERHFSRVEEMPRHLRARVAY